MFLSCLAEDVYILEDGEEAIEGNLPSYEDTEGDILEDEGLVFEDQEPEAQEPEAQEPEDQEPEAQEPEAQEPEDQEPEAQETEAQETEQQESGQVIQEDIPKTETPEKTIDDLYLLVYALMASNICCFGVIAGMLTFKVIFR